MDQKSSLSVRCPSSFTSGAAVTGDERLPTGGCGTNQFIGPWMRGWTRGTMTKPADAGLSMGDDCAVLPPNPRGVKPTSNLLFYFGRQPVAPHERERPHTKLSRRTSTRRPQRHWHAHQLARDGVGLGALVCAITLSAPNRRPLRLVLFMRRFLVGRTVQ